MKYILVVYDINEKRVNKIHRILKKYLLWEQNSTFEGYITKGNTKKLLGELTRKMDLNEDSVVVYFFNSKETFRKIVDGKDKCIVKNNFI